MSKWTNEQARNRAKEVANIAGVLYGDFPAEAVGRRILDLESELAAMRAVVEAAEYVRTSYDHDGGGGMSSEHQQCVLNLNAKVDAYRAQREGK